MKVYLLAGADGSPLAGDSIRDFVAEPVTLRGHLKHSGAVDVLWADLATLRRE
jgi:hypothetical protein